MHSQPFGQISGHFRRQAILHGTPLQSSPLTQASASVGKFGLVRYPRRKLATCSAATSASSSIHGQPRENIKPAYNKYRTRADIEASYLRQWKEVTARGDGGQRRMTMLSVASWWPLFFKYHVVPSFMRFFWWVLVWAPLMAVHHQIHRFTVKLGARLDAALARRSNGGRQTFSLAMVLRRYHHTISPVASAVHRWRLLKGVPEPLPTPKLENPPTNDEEKLSQNPEDLGSPNEGFGS